MKQIVLILMLLEGLHALTCYKCSVKDVICTHNSCTGPTCMRIITNSTVNGVTVVKDCSSVRADDGCKSVSQSGATGTVCYCNTDFCNIVRDSGWAAAYLPAGRRVYSCMHCRAHLANHDELISKSFQGSHGKAYLFNSVVNVACGQAEQRVLLTGLHAVADISCENCHTTVGWKYEHAFESTQKYKEGKFIIEQAHMIKDNGWDLER